MIQTEWKVPINAVKWSPHGDRIHGYTADEKEDWKKIEKIESRYKLIYYSNDIKPNALFDLYMQNTKKHSATGWMHWVKKNYPDYLMNIIITLRLEKELVDIDEELTQRYAKVELFRTHYQGLYAEWMIYNTLSKEKDLKVEKANHIDDSNGTDLFIDGNPYQIKTNYGLSKAKDEPKYQGMGFIIYYPGEIKDGVFHFKIK